MRVVLGGLWMISTLSLAAPAPLRFAISDSWAMPMVQIEQGPPTQGILYDLMLSLATQDDCTQSPWWKNKAWVVMCATIQPSPCNGSCAPCCA